MTLEQLKSAWRSEMSRPPTAGPTGFEALRDEVTEVDRALQFRDVWIVGSLVIGVGLQIVFGWLVQPVVDPLTKVGTVVFGLAVATICVVLLGARRVEPADDWTLRARLRREIDKLDRQRRIAESVAVWFLLPMIPAIVLGSLGGQHLRTGSYAPSAHLLVYYALCAAVFVTTYWLQRREARRHFGPLLARLRALCAELDEKT
jgi:hypothetical protein